MADFSGEHDVPGWWDHEEREIYDQLLGGEPEIEQDATLQMLFHEAMFDQELDPLSREHAYGELISYLWDEYGIDFEADFDWESYREWYENAA